MNKRILAVGMVLGVVACSPCLGVHAAPAASTARENTPTNVAPEVWAKIAPQLRASRYAFEADENGGFKARNPAHGFEIAADAAGVRVVDAAPSPREMLVLRAVKLGSAGSADLALPQGVRPVVQGARLEYRRGTVTEWFENRKEGLEQGFTIESPSDLSALSDLQLLVDIAGARTVTIEVDGQRARITDEQGRDFGYGGLKAWDATGKELKVWMKNVGPSGGCRIVAADNRTQQSASLQICADARQAVYPITIDPMLTSMEKKLTASDGGMNDYFGFSVSVAGDVALVGAHVNNSAYVFERNTGGTNSWGQVKKLTASDGAAGDYFGYSVSVAGDVALVSLGRWRGAGRAECRCRAITMGMESATWPFSTAIRAIGISGP